LPAVTVANPEILKSLACAMPALDNSAAIISFFMLFIG
jgi:hypothetical protein